MHESDDVRAAMLRFYERFSGGDPEAFGEMITTGDRALVIGTDPGQWAEGRDTWVAGYRSQIEAIPDLRLEAGDLRASAEGGMGWAADRPRVVLPDGTVLPSRLTAVLGREEGVWRLVHLHLSFGVPDDKLEELAPALFA